MKWDVVCCRCLLIRNFALLTCIFRYIDTYYDIEIVKKRHPDADDEQLKRLARFRTLVSLMLSSQTKDTENFKAMTRLIEFGLTIDSILAVDNQQLDEMIRNVGFHNKKVLYLKRAALICKEQHAGDIPNTFEGLKALPGVGPKMAHLAMQSAWGEVLGVSVDTHVHRIAARLGWTRRAKTPGDTAAQLETLLPRERWSRANHMLVGHGQTICTPLKPKCDECLLFHASLCARVGVGHSGLKRNKTI
jgi:endonuclease-3